MSVEDELDLARRARLWVGTAVADQLDAAILEPLIRRLGRFSCSVQPGQIDMAWEALHAYADAYAAAQVCATPSSSHRVVLPQRGARPNETRGPGSSTRRSVRRSTCAA